MADDQHRLAGLGQERFEPFGGFDVEVVRWLVEQHQIGLAQQQLGQHEPVLLPAAELFDGAAEAGPVEAQAVEDALHLVIEVIGVVVLQFVLQPVVTLPQLCPLVRVVGLGKGLGDGLGIAGQRHQIL